jgi:Type I site-specific restriction-modification system, R (restriction) subunit and related helicases
MENKKKLSEEDIKNRHITPAMEKAGWRKEQMRMEFLFTDGRVILDGKKGKRGVRKKADYLLYYRSLNSNFPLAIVEAKDNNHTPAAGIQQAINYANILDVPFVFSSNGDSFVEYDRKTGLEKEVSLDTFPSPEDLWLRFKSDKNITSEQEGIITQPYFYKQGDKTPRYYQQIAINRTIEAIAQEKKRLLLVMATGTGKTYTAFQIIHRLLESGTKKKILYLADRNILIDQTMQQDFKLFKKIMTKVENRKLDSSYKLYMSLYQQLAGDENEEPFRQFQPTFFDFIVVDECHRGSARDESRWRKILDYFSSAVQLGMTATPKVDENVNTFDYFGGKPIYTYSLKEGIDDGFLAPYKVIRSLINVDDSWRPSKGMLDENGEEIEDREYNLKDYDRNIILKDRTAKVAKRITEWLKENGRMSKVIVFCVGVNHADRMRQELGNLNADLKAQDDRYVMRITGDDNEGKKQLEYFIDEDSKYPVIATTSKLMTTGVDCKTVKLIVLDNNINSMTEFAPYLEQLRIVECINLSMSIVDKYQEYVKQLDSLENNLSESLKKSILQYAIQGKLVSQNPNDELASALLDKIREEKKQLIKEKRIKPDKHESFIFKGADNKYYEKIGNRVACIEEEIPFQIPESWEWVRLGSISKTIHYGYTASASKTGNCKLLRITDIQNNMVFWNTVPYCTVSDKELLVYGLNNRDILIARTGGTIGKSFIISNMEGDAVFASYLIRVIPVENINEQYIKLFLESPFYWFQLTALSMGTGQPNVNGKSLSSLLIPLPPFKEQERVLKKTEVLKNKFLSHLS